MFLFLCFFFPRPFSWGVLGFQSFFFNKFIYLIIFNSILKKFPKQEFFDSVKKKQFKSVFETCFFKFFSETNLGTFEVSFWFFLGTKDKMVGMRANERKVKEAKIEPLRNFISIWR